jgi:hypothetical protein
LRGIVHVLTLQAVVGFALAILDWRARGDLLGTKYGPPMLLIAFELGLSLAAGLLAGAVRAGQRTALGPVVAMELCWIGAGVWAVMTGGGAAIMGALIGLVVLTRLASAGARAEARALSPYDQQVVWSEEHGVGFSVHSAPQPFASSAVEPAHRNWGRRSTDRLPQ